ncbi:MAG: tetratricopeptide repeat protein [bacterium]
MNGTAIESIPQTTLLQRFAAIILLFLAVTVSYHRTIDNPFVWDDPILITQNHLIQNPDNLKQLFTRNYFTQGIEISYRPVNTLTFFSDFALWGNRPAGYHLINLLLHFFNSLLLFGLLARLLRRPWLGLGMAVIFAVHPVLTEALNAVTFREDPLCLFFLLISFTLYISRSDGGRAAGALKCAGAFLTFFLALFTKETAVVFPAVILAAEYFISENPSRKKALASFALFSLPAIFYLFVRFGPMRGPAESVIYHGGGPWPTALLAIQAWARYFTLFIWPARLCVTHEFPVSPRFFDASTLSAVFVLIAVAACILIACLRVKRAGFGAVWFVLMLLPVSNIIPIGVVMAERYIYMAMPGLLIFAGFVLKDFFLRDGNKYPSLSRVVLTVLVVVLAVLAAVATNNRNKVWDNTISFWKAACDCAPNSAYGFVNLGMVEFEANKYEDAKTSLVRAVRLASGGTQNDLRYGTLYRALSNLGIVYAKENQPEKAIGLLKASARLNPNSPYSFMNLGVVYFKNGDDINAERFLLRGVELMPSNVQARFYLLTIYMHSSKLKEALEQCDAILSITPEDEGIRILRSKITKRMSDLNSSKTDIND